MPPINASMSISMFQPPHNPTLIYPSFQRLVIKMISSRIYGRGYAKHPCTQSACCKGFAVRPIRAYPSEYHRKTLLKNNYIRVVVKIDPVEFSGLIIL